ncbi:hypothetical protein LXL04_025547 [Taraxacum kok-saghyz]
MIDNIIDIPRDDRERETAVAQRVLVGLVGLLAEDLDAGKRTRSKGGSEEDAVEKIKNPPEKSNKAGGKRSWVGSEIWVGSGTHRYWSVWKARNDKVFEEICVSTSKLADNIITMRAEEREVDCRIRLVPNPIDSQSSMTSYRLWHI